MNPTTEENLKAFYDGIHSKWKPHAKQIEIIQSLFHYQKREIFLECGRNFGKTDIFDYCLWRKACLTPGSKSYIFYPFKKQAREVIWKSNRIINFGPHSFVADTNDTEMRITFHNTSFIKLDGSDNTQAYRGVKITDGSLIVYDELKDFRPEFHDAMDPNLIDAYLMMGGTPPETWDDSNQFINLADECKTSAHKQYFHGECWDNPHIDPEMLNKKKDQLYRRGDGEIWEREYLARRVKGGASSILPMFNADRIVQKHDSIISEIRHDIHKLEYYLLADPGTTTCFGVLLIILNPWTRKIYLLDEIYERDQRKTSSKLIGKEIVIKTAEYYKKAQWDYIYDEAAAWFENEISTNDEFDMWFRPTNKSQWGKLGEERPLLSQMKDAILDDMLVVSDRCVWFVWECENYIKDRNGKIPKGNDHLIDLFRYFLGMSAYDTNDRTPPKLPKKLEKFVSKLKGFRGDQGDASRQWGDYDESSEDSDWSVQETW